MRSMFTPTRSVAMCCMWWLHEAVIPMCSERAKKLKAIYIFVMGERAELVVTFVYLARVRPYIKKS